MSAFTRVADVVQKGAVLGLFSVFAFQIYQINDKTREYSRDQAASKNNNQHVQIMSEINKKVQEESQPHTIDKIPDRYDRDDDSYLKKAPKLSDYAKRSWGEKVFSKRDFKEQFACTDLVFAQQNGLYCVPPSETLPVTVVL